MSVLSWMALQTRYMPTLARMVVMSQVASACTTWGRASSTCSFVMMTSVWSAPMKSATSRAYFKSMASPSMPMAKVRMGFCRFLAAMAHTRLESSPPESRKPRGASASSRFSTPATSFSRMLRHTSSSGAWT